MRELKELGDVVEKGLRVEVEVKRSSGFLELNFR